MAQTCITCGREFELTEKEIEFYESHGLNLPNRCKDCRQVKKTPKSSGQEQAQPGGESHNSSEAAFLKAQGGKQRIEQDADNPEEAGPLPGWTKGKLIATAVIMVVVLIVCFGGTYLVHQFM